MNSSEAPVEIVRLYNLLGEGCVVELRDGEQTHLYDRQGLQHRILMRKKQGLDTRVEDQALAHINAYEPSFSLVEYAPSERGAG